MIVKILDKSELPPDSSEEERSEPEQATTTSRAAVTDRDSLVRLMRGFGQRNKEQIATDDKEANTNIALAKMQFPNSVEHSQHSQHWMLSELASTGRRRVRSATRTRWTR